jgi:hypothetical protein
MTYAEAIQKSLTVKWKVDTCDQGEECWCRIVKCEEPLMYKEREDSDEDEYWPIRAGEVGKETVEHIVKLHNKSIKK